MTDVLVRFNSQKLWDFKGGIHPAEMKTQSNTTPIGHLPLSTTFYIPVKQHAGNAGNLLVKIGQTVLKGQPLTQGDGLRALPIHAPTSGKIVQIAPHFAAHPSGLSELTITIKADGRDEWVELQPTEDWVRQTPTQLVEKIYQSGVAGLGGAAFPTAAKIEGAENKVKLLIINGAECEPYITCDDRLMRDNPLEIIEGIRILRYILHPEKVVIAIEDNKPEAVVALQEALHGSNDIEIRVIPTKYPSGAAKQLIQVLTGLEIPTGQRSSSLGIYMQNVATAFAIQRAIIHGEPLIERVITLTGDKLPHKGNFWTRIGTPIAHLLQSTGYQYDERFPIFFGGPMMGFILHHLQAPITKMANCIIAPDHFEYSPPPEEQSCIRCSACSDACPVRLMPQQMYWFARAEDHEKSEEYSLFDCIECGLCAYVCPSHIPLIQYFRQEKAKITEIRQKAKQSEEAKIRFEARQARLEKEKQQREARTRQAAAHRREEIANQQGIDPVQAALERLKNKKQSEQAETKKEIKIITGIRGEILPDNDEIIAQRKARRLARQTEQEHKTESQDNKQAAIAAAIARAKAKKAQMQSANTKSEYTENAESAVEISPVAINLTEQDDPRKAAIAAAIARAKAKKAQIQSANTKSEYTENAESAVEISPVATNLTEQDDPRKAAIAAAIARAKAKKAAMRNNETN